MRTCPNCKELNGDDNEYCYKCKTYIGPIDRPKKICRKCGIIYDGNKTYCDTCSGSLSIYNDEPKSAIHSMQIIKTKLVDNKKIKRLIIMAIILILFIFLLVKCYNVINSPTAPSDMSAFTYAQSIVKQNLKSPSSADFCKFSEATISHNGNDYVVGGYVDADNSFGAHVRSTFIVTFTLTEDGCENIQCRID